MSVAKVKSGVNKRESNASGIRKQGMEWGGVANHLGHDRLRGLGLVLQVRWGVLNKGPTF